MGGALSLLTMTKKTTAHDEKLVNIVKEKKTRKSKWCIQRFKYRQMERIIVT